MEVLDVIQVEEVAEPSVCQMPLDPIPEVPKPVDNPVSEEVVKEDVKPKRGLGHAKGFRPAAAKVEKFSRRSEF